MENRLPLLDATDRVFIAGRWRSGASSETLPLINPSDGSTLAAIARGTAADIDAAVAAAQAALLAAAVPEGAFAPDAINQKATHGFRGGAEEMGASLPGLFVLARQLEPGFMDEGRGLQRVSGILARDLAGGQAAQLIVNKRKQFLGGQCIALSGALQNLSHVAHVSDLPERFIEA